MVLLVYLFTKPTRPPVSTSNDPAGVESRKFWRFSTCEGSGGLCLGTTDMVDDRDL